MEIYDYIQKPDKYIHSYQLKGNFSILRLEWELYVKETLLSRSNCKEMRVERSPAKPFDKQPSTAHGDLEEHNELLCLTISVQSSVVFPGGLLSQFAGLGAVSLILLKLKAGSRSV